MTRIKICGVKNEEDISIVNRYLPDYVGFVFAESKRQIELIQAQVLIQKLNPAILKVGVFVNEEMNKLIEFATRLKLDVIQLSGDETPEYIDTARTGIGDGFKSLEQEKSIEIWKGIRVKNNTSLDHMACFGADAYLLDAFVEGSFGGSGKTFNWDLAKCAAQKVRIILAGGLNSTNINNAIYTVNPYAVDVSSGVEGIMGKDEAKIKEFIEKVKG